MEAQIIPIETIAESTTNPRREKSKDALADLAASIKTQGLLTPIIVRPLPPEKVNGHMYELVCGSRRLAAMRQNGETAIHAIVRDFDDLGALEAQIVENLQRQDVTPIEEAEAYEHLKKQIPDCTVEDIARAVGKRPEYVARRLSLLNLISDWRKMMKKGELTLEQALYICRFPIGEQKDILKRFENRGSISIGSLRDYAERSILNEISKAPFDTKATYGKYNPCHMCNDRSGAQSILFGDMDGKDRCLNSPCWQTKRMTHAEQTVAKLKESGVTLAVQESYYGDKNPLAEGLPTVERHAVRAVTKEDKAENRAFTIIDLDPNSPDYGRTRVVALTTNRALTEKPAKGRPTEQSLNERKARLLRESTNRKRIALGQALVKKVSETTPFPDTLPAPILKSLVPAAVAMLGSEGMKTFSKLIGVEVKSGNWDDVVKQGRETYLASLKTGAALTATLFAALMSSDLLVSTYGEGNDAILTTLTARYKVDAIKEFEAIDADMKPRFDRMNKDREALTNPPAKDKTPKTKKGA